MKHLFITGLLMIGLTSAGCGGTAGTGTGSSGGGGSGVNIRGQVETPTSTSTSVSLSAKSADSGNSGDSGSPVSIAKAEGGNGNEGNSGGQNESEEVQVIVSKATSDVPASSGTCKAITPSGTVLDPAGIISNSGEISGIVVDPTLLDSTKQVIIEAESGGNKFTKIIDLTGKKVGDSVSGGTIDSDSTLAVQQVYFQAGSDCSPANITSACAAKFASGEVKPLALFETFFNGLDVSSSASSDNAAGASQALRKAFRAAMANGKVPFSEINSALSGGSALNTWKGFEPDLKNIDMSTAITHIQNYIPAVAKTFADSATFDKYYSAGAAGWKSCANFFAKKTKDDLTNDINNPESIRGFLNQKATSFIAGDTAAFDSMKKEGLARMMSQFAGKAGSTAFTSGQYEALEKLVDAQKAKFDNLASSKFASMGEAFFNQLKACNTTAEIDLVKNNPGNFVSKIHDNPGAYIGSGGVDIFNNQFATFVQDPTGFNSGSGCSVDADCNAPMSACSPFRYCVAPCTSNCPFGAKCTNNGQCATGFCLANGACGAAADTNPLSGVLRAVGSSCTDGPTQCASRICSSSVCAGVVGTGEASFAGFYKRNAGGTLITAINLNGGVGGGSVSITFGPDNPSSPSSNSVFGGCTLTGSSSPFSVASCNTVANPSGTSGTIVCDGSGGSTTLALSSGTLTGTCVLGGGLSGTLTVDHTKL